MFVGQVIAEDSHRDLALLSTTATECVGLEMANADAVALGEEVFAALRAEGRRLSVEEVVRLAQAHLEPAPLNGLTTEAIHHPI